MPKKLLLDGVKALIVDQKEVETSFQNIDRCLSETFINCLVYATQNDTTPKDPQKLFEIESLIDYLHDELNTGHWSEVPLLIRRAFTAASFIKTLILIIHSDNLEECLRCVDLGLLLGAPLEINCDLLTQVAKFLSEQKSLGDNDVTSCNINKPIGKKKRKEVCECLENFDKISATILDTVSCPSLETFNKKYLTPQLPVKLQGCLSNAVFSLFIFLMFSRLYVSLACF